MAATLAVCSAAAAQAPMPQPSELSLKKCRISAAIYAHRIGVTASRVEALVTERQEGRFLRLTVRVFGEIAGEKAVFSGFCLQTDDMRLVSELAVVE
ncbi:MAG: hypothetical protein AB7O88_23310 [Reyranellaceae bacterium]